MKVKLYEPLEYQREAIDYVVHNPIDKIVTIKSSRQCGKTYTLANLLSYFSLTHYNRESFFISPTYRQAKNVYKIIEKNLGKILKCNGTELVITYPTGSTLQFLSGEQDEDTLRGFTCSGLLVYDEAAFLKDSVYNVSRAYTLVHHPTMILVSTPKFKSGRYYEYCVDNQSDRIKHFEWRIEDNPFVDEEQMEQIRRETPIHIYKAEYCNEWMDAFSSVFGDLQPVISNDYEIDNELVAGIDFGVGAEAGEDSDYTVLTIFNSKHQMVCLDYFNNLNETQAVERLAKKINSYNVKKVIAEENSLGNVLIGLLKKKITCNLEKFNTNNKSKNEIINNLQVEIQNRTCQLLDDNELKMQFSAYEMQKTKGGFVTYNAAKGYHDDIVMATAICLWGLRKKNKISYI